MSKKKQKMELFVKDGEIHQRSYIDLKVTAEDILMGETGDTNSCAIALAVSRACPNYTPDVGGSGFSVGEFVHDEDLSAKVNRQLDRFVQDFDSLDGEPGSAERKEAIKQSKIKPFKVRLGLVKSTGAMAECPCG